MIVLILILFLSMNGENIKKHIQNIKILMSIKIVMQKLLNILMVNY